MDDFKFLLVKIAIIVVVIGTAIIVIVWFSGNTPRQHLWDECMTYETIGQMPAKCLELGH